MAAPAPTPWQTGGAQPEPESAAPLLPAGQVRRAWRYAAAAVGSVAVFIMMFQTWMQASERSGIISVDAFGTIHTTTTYLNLFSSSYSHQLPPGVAVSGIWGMLATIAIFVTVFAAIQAVYRGTRTAGLVAAVAATVVAVIVLIDVFYLDTKKFTEQVSMKMNNDLGSHIGLVISALRGTGNYPWPGVPYPIGPDTLTPWAFIASAVAFLSAALAAIQAWHTGGLREIVSRSWTQRHQTRPVGRWLSDERSRVQTLPPPHGGSPASDSAPTEHEDDRDWGAAG
jgi:hypothetical protein